MTRVDLPLLCGNCAGTGAGGRRFSGGPAGASIGFLGVLGCCRLASGESLRCQASGPPLASSQKMWFASGNRASPSASLGQHLRWARHEGFATGGDMLAPGAISLERRFAYNLDRFAQELADARRRPSLRPPGGRAPCRRPRAGRGGHRERVYRDGRGRPCGRALPAGHHREDPGRPGTAPGAGPARVALGALRVRRRVGESEGTKM